MLNLNGGILPEQESVLLEAKDSYKITVKKKKRQKKSQSQQWPNSLGVIGQRGVLLPTPGEKKAIAIAIATVTAIGSMPELNGETLLAKMMYALLTKHREVRLGPNWKFPPF